MGDLQKFPAKWGAPWPSSSGQRREGRLASAKHDLRAFRQKDLTDHSQPLEGGGSPGRWGRVPAPRAGEAGAEAGRGGGKRGGERSRQLQFPWRRAVPRTTRPHAGERVRAGRRAAGSRLGRPRSPLRTAGHSRFPRQGRGSAEPWAA